MLQDIMRAEAKTIPYFKRPFIQRSVSKNQYQLNDIIKMMSGKGLNDCSPLMIGLYDEDHHKDITLEELKEDIMEEIIRLNRGFHKKFINNSSYYRNYRNKKKSTQNDIRINIFNLRYKAHKSNKMSNYKVNIKKLRGRLHKLEYDFYNFYDEEYAILLDKIGSALISYASKHGYVYVIDGQQECSAINRYEWCKTIYLSQKAYFKRKGLKINKKCEGAPVYKEDMFGNNYHTRFCSIDIQYLMRPRNPYSKWLNKKVRSRCVQTLSSEHPKWSKSQIEHKSDLRIQSIKHLVNEMRHEFVKYRYKYVYIDPTVHTDYNYKKSHKKPTYSKNHNLKAKRMYKKGYKDKKYQIQYTCIIDTKEKLECKYVNEPHRKWYIVFNNINGKATRPTSLQILDDEWLKYRFTVHKSTKFGKNCLSYCRKMYKDKMTKGPKGSQMKPSNLRPDKNGNGIITLNYLCGFLGHLLIEGIPSLSLNDSIISDQHMGLRFFQLYTQDFPSKEQNTDGLHVCRKIATKKIGDDGKGVWELKSSVINMLFSIAKGINDCFYLILTKQIKNGQRKYVKIGAPTMLIYSFLNEMFYDIKSDIKCSKSYPGMRVAILVNPDDWTGKADSSLEKHNKGMNLYRNSKITRDQCCANLSHRLKKYKANTLAIEDPHHKYTFKDLIHKIRIKFTNDKVVKPLETVLTNLEDPNRLKGNEGRTYEFDHNTPVQSAVEGLHVNDIGNINLVPESLNNPKSDKSFSPEVQEIQDLKDKLANHDVKPKDIKATRAKIRKARNKCNNQIDRNSSRKIKELSKYLAIENPSN